LVYNPKSDREYKVAVRDYQFGMNFCSCPDFKVNGPGTRKHIEFVLKQLKDNHANDIHWLKGYQRTYSSVSLKYGEKRKVFLRIGTGHSGEISIIASYGVALNDIDYLNKAQFDLVILDEAQRIKNWKTKTAGKQ